MKRTIPVLAALGTLAALAGLWATSCSLDMRYEKYAIVFGVADYPGTANDLSWTVADAQAMTALLTAQGFAVYERTNAGATRTELVSLLGTVNAAAAEEDLVVFYFSGHGGLGAQGVGVIYLYDDPIESGAFTDRELADALRILRPSKKIVIIDACNSGGFIADVADVDGVPADYTGTIYLSLGKLGSALSAYFTPGADSDITPGEAIVLSAAGEREFSYEDYSDGRLGYSHGVFTYYLLQAPKRGDKNGDGFVTVTEAYDYTRRMIDQYWNSEVYYLERFSPHVSGGPLDYVLFGAE